MQGMKTRFTLRTAREMKKLTQEQAAKLIGISVDTLGNYERGKSYPGAYSKKDRKSLRRVLRTAYFFTFGLR